MGFLRYKGYVGSVTYNDKNNTLEGELQGVKLGVTYSSHSLQGLEREFQKTVDDYVARCERKGLKPRKSYDGPINVRLGIELASKVAQKADDDGVTINTVIKAAVSEYLSTKDKS